MVILLSLLSCLSSPADNRRVVAFNDINPVESEERVEVISKVDELFQSIWQDDAESVKRLLESGGVGPLARDERGHIAISRAISSGTRAVVGELMKFVRRIPSNLPRHMDPFCIAWDKGDLPLAFELLEKCGSFSFKEGEREVPYLYLATRSLKNDPENYQSRIIAKLGELSNFKEITYLSPRDASIQIQQRILMAYQHRYMAILNEIAAEEENGKRDSVVQKVEEAVETIAKSGERMMASLCGENGINILFYILLYKLEEKLEFVLGCIDHKEIIEAAKELLLERDREVYDYWQNHPRYAEMCKTGETKKFLREIEDLREKSKGEFSSASAQLLEDILNDTSLTRIEQVKLASQVVGAIMRGFIGGKIELKALVERLSTNAKTFILQALPREAQYEELRKALSVGKRGIFRR